MSAHDGSTTMDAPIVEYDGRSCRSFEVIKTVAVIIGFDMGFHFSEQVPLFNGEPGRRLLVIG